MVGLAVNRIQQVKDFLQHHFDIAQQNVKQIQDRYKKYADEHRRLITFEGDKVFLKAPKHSQNVKTGPVAKLSP